MVIPSPKFELIEPDLTGYSWLGQVLYTLKNPPRFKLAEDWVIVLNNGLVIIVPKGFETDGASIPRLLWFLISPVGVLFRGAVLHDFGYQYGFLLCPVNKFREYNIPLPQLYQEYSVLFGPYVPIHIGEGSRFFDQLLRFITIEVSHATFIAGAACYVLGIFGHVVWDKYRSLGPAAFNSNSLNLPGVMEENS